MSPWYWLSAGGWRPWGGADRGCIERAGMLPQQSLAKHDNRSGCARHALYDRAFCPRGQGVARPRHRNLLRRNGRGRLRHGPGTRRARASLAGRDARGVRRRRARAGVARPRAARRAAGCAGAPGGRDRHGGPGRHRLHAGPGARRRAAGGRQRGHGDGVRAFDPDDSRAPPRRPPAVAAAERAGARVPVRRAARLGRPQPALRRRGRRPLSAARRHARRRGGRGVRQDRENARPAVSRRPCARATRATARRAPSRCRVRCSRPATSTSASPGSRPPC